MKTPEQAYLEAVKAIGRPHRPLEVVTPTHWEANRRADSMLVLVDGWILDSGDLPAFALQLEPGRIVLGHTHTESPFAGHPGLPKLFEGTQCELEIGDDARMLADYSTNGTLIVPAKVFSKASSGYLQDFAPRYQDAPLPRALSPHDVLITQYAALVYVKL